MIFRILLADYSVTIQKVIRHTFPEERYGVSIAEDSEDFFKRLKNEKPDIILIEMDFFDMPPGKTVGLIRDIGQSYRPYIVLLASINQDVTIEMIGTWKVDDFLLKPLDNKELLSKIEAYINSRILRSEISEDSAEYDEAGEDVSADNLALALDAQSKKQIRKFREEIGKFQSDLIQSFDEKIKEAIAVSQGTAELKQGDNSSSSEMVEDLKRHQQSSHDELTAFFREFKNELKKLIEKVPTDATFGLRLNRFASELFKTSVSVAHWDRLTGSLEDAFKKIGDLEAKIAENYEIFNTILNKLVQWDQSFKKFDELNDAMETIALRIAEHGERFDSFNEKLSSWESQLQRLTENVEATAGRERSSVSSGASGLELSNEDVLRLERKIMELLDKRLHKMLEYKMNEIVKFYLK